MDVESCFEDRDEVFRACAVHGLEEIAWSSLNKVWHRINLKTHLSALLCFRSDQSDICAYRQASIVFIRAQYLALFEV